MKVMAALHFPQLKPHSKGLGLGLGSFLATQMFSNE